MKKVLFFVCAAAIMTFGQSVDAQAKTRLKQIIWHGSDGTYRVKNNLFYDPKFEVECAIGELEPYSNIYYCVPTTNIVYAHNIGPSEYFLDKNCTREVPMYAFKSNQPIKFYRHENKFYRSAKIHTKAYQKSKYVCSGWKNRKSSGCKDEIRCELVKDNSYIYIETLKNEIPLSDFIKFEKIISE